MQYDLVFYTDLKNGQYIKIKDFRDSSTLKGIIEFCNLFENYDDLMYFLIKIGYLSKPITDGVFKIHSRICKNSKPKVFTKDVTYANEKDFFNISFLEDYYVSNMLNPEFITPLLETYFNYFISRSKDAANYLYDIRFSYSHRIFSSNFVDRDLPDLETSLRNFIRTFTLRINGKGKSVINYPNLILLSRHAVNFYRKTTGYDPNVHSDEYLLQMNDENQRTKEEIKHYKELLKDTNPDSDEYYHYTSMLKNLQENLNLSLVRRKTNEFAED